MAATGSPLEAILTALVRAACHEVLPAELDDLSSGKDAVRPSATLAGADFESRAPWSAFCRLRAAPRFRAADGAVEYATVSDLGLERTWRFADASELASAINLRLPPTAIIADARAGGGGRILLTTRAHLEWQLAHGQLHCGRCGLFCAGERGMRDHMLVKHRAPYEAALETARESRTQLVPWTPPPAGTLSMLALAQRQALLQKREARGCLELDEGLRAAREGDLPALVALVEGGYDARAARDRHGSSALLWAAGGGHVAVCRFLCEECGLDALEAQRKDGRCALHWAARNGHLNVVRWLVSERGESPDRRAHDGTVALHWAVWQEHEQVGEWLVCEAGADLHATNSFGCNAVQWAALSGSVRMCVWLQRLGLDLQLRNCNGHSALHKGAVRGQFEVCRWLVANADLDSRHMQMDGDGNTPARMAAAEGHAELSQWLEAVAQRWLLLERESG
ncbi:ankyrin repeat-containing domain protein [Pavlovales sp. CCMP2436]|nr:ankyrin repeat-containing domain protein [Pavlovales sp. CCMP2436]